MIETCGTLAVAFWFVLQLEISHRTHRTFDALRTTHEEEGVVFATGASHRVCAVVAGLLAILTYSLIIVHSLRTLIVTKSIQLYFPVITQQTRRSVFAGQTLRMASQTLIN